MANRKTRTLYRDEKHLENHVLAASQKCGYVAHHNSQRRYRQQCPLPCNRPPEMKFFVPAGGTGETTGLPDTVHRRPNVALWPPSLMAGVELKIGPQADVRPAQVKRLNEGCSVIAYTPEAACRFLNAMTDLLRAIPVDAWLRFDRTVRAIPDLVRPGTAEAAALTERHLAKSVGSTKKKTGQERRSRRSNTERHPTNELPPEGDPPASTGRRPASRRATNT